MRRDALPRAQYRTCQEQAPTRYRRMPKKAGRDGLEPRGRLFHGDVASHTRDWALRTSLVVAAPPSRVLELLRVRGWVAWRESLRNVNAVSGTFQTHSSEADE